MHACTRTHVLKIVRRHTPRNSIVATTAEIKENINNNNRKCGNQIITFKYPFILSFGLPCTLAHRNNPSSSIINVHAPPLMRAIKRMLLFLNQHSKIG